MKSSQNEDTDINIDEDTYNASEEVVERVEGQKYEENPVEGDSCPLIQTGSESPEEATNESVENEAAVSEVLGERAPRGGQRPSERRGEPAQRQQGVPVERVHLRISEEFCLVDLKLLSHTDQVLGHAIN